MSALRKMAQKKHYFRGFSFIIGEMDTASLLIWLFLSAFIFIIPKFLVVITLDIRFSPWFSSLSLVLWRSPLLYYMMMFWSASASFSATTISSVSSFAKIKLCFESLFHGIFYQVESCFVCQKWSSQLFYWESFKIFGFDNGCYNHVIFLRQDSKDLFNSFWWASKLDRLRPIWLSFSVLNLSFCIRWHIFNFICSLGRFMDTCIFVPNIIYFWRILWVYWAYYEDLEEKII